MVSMILFLFGVLVGASLMLWTHVLARRHASQTSHFDTQYGPARRVVLRQLRAHGTINLRQLERMLDVPAPQALRFLDQMILEGIITRQNHRDDGAFYTLVVR